ncbi:hypothetical protein ACFS4T_04740 [Pseudomonas lini]
MRPITIKEESPGQPARIIERFSYGDSSKDSAALNRCGVLIRHDDEAGTLLIDEYSPGGKPSRQTRHFLLNAESLDWPAEEHSRNLLRETGDGYKNAMALRRNGRGHPAGGCRSTPAAIFL